MNYEARLVDDQQRVEHDTELITQIYIANILNVEYRKKKRSTISDLRFRCISRKRGGPSYRKR